MANPLMKDLEHVLNRTAGLWGELRGSRIFITGGTGFFGCWLLETFAWANDNLGLSAEAVVLTRNPEFFARKVPHLAAHPAIRLTEGDIRSFDFPKENFTHIIHAATEASTTAYEESSLLMLDTIIGGTRRTLEFAKSCRPRKFLLVSSGAVYGKQPPKMRRLPEDHQGAPDTMDAGSAYGEGKRAAELLCSIYAGSCGFEAKIARCFAFVGPYLPLDGRYAIGNFISDALAGKAIKVNGDGTPFRSYLYAADLAVWLWTILFQGKSCRPYNVGSANDVTVAELARVVANELRPGVEVRIAQKAVPDAHPTRYVPSVTRASEELSLRETINLTDAIKRTAMWYASVKKESYACI